MKKHNDVLIFTSIYFPGFKGGGPIRTIVNMVEALGCEINFSLVTLDRDLGDINPYPNVKSDAWQQVGKAQVYYASPAHAFTKILKIIRNLQGDALHLNSFFSFRFSILPLLIARWAKPQLPIVVGPRGEFSEGALILKSAKKRLYITMAKLLGFYKNVIWHASTVHEAEDIRRVMGKDAVIRTAIDIATPEANLTLTPRREGTPLRVIFISRISPKKNLFGAIEILKKVQCPVDFHVYGPAEDQAYWAECQSAAAALPRHVSFSYKGTLQAQQVAQKFAEYDLFLFPTLGETFGHVIAEALSAGLPVLLSNNTPWRDLEAKELGWDLALGQTEGFVRCIEACHDKSAVEYNQWREQIRVWALQNIGDQEAIEQNRQLFMNLRPSYGH